MFDILFNRWREKLFLVLIIASVTWLALELVNWLVSEKSLPITELVLEGDRAYVEDTEVLDSLRDIPQGGNFFTLDVTSVQERVESLAWIRQASVRKQWPNRLVIYLHEQDAVAWWNKTHFLNVYGEVFDAPERLNKTLVQLRGPVSLEKKVLEAYLQLKQLLELTDFEITKLELSKRHDWNLELKNGIKLIIGQNNMLDRVQRFIDLYPLIDDKEKIAYLDLRYDTGISVGWLEGEIKLTNQ